MSFRGDTSNRTSWRTARLGALILLAAAHLACDDSGPINDVFFFEGDLAYQGTQTHSLVSMDEGIARFEVLELRPILIDATFASSLVVGLGLGRPGDEGCATSFRTSARQGSVFSIGLEKETDYCVEIFDSGTLPEDALISYMVSVSPG